MGTYEDEDEDADEDDDDDEDEDEDDDAPVESESDESEADESETAWSSELSPSPSSSSSSSAAASSELPSTLSSAQLMQLLSAPASLPAALGAGELSAGEGDGGGEELAARLGEPADSVQDAEHELDRSCRGGRAPGHQNMMNPLSPMATELP